jgi:cytochrome c oxidase subunit III
LADHAQAEPHTLAPHQQHQFETMEQQQETSTLGMWAFLVTEVMFFGGLFGAYTVYRYLYPQAFSAASQHLNYIIGAINTGVLIGSSMTMALAVRAAQLGNRRSQVVFLLLTIVLGSTFLGIKVVEYHDKFVHHLVPGSDFHFEGPYGREAQIFFSLYFAMTGMHAVHMIIGIGMLSTLTVLAWRGNFSSQYYTPVELGGLYWHFVDIVWIYLFPLLYLIRGG